MLNYIKKTLLNYRETKAIKKANRLKNLTGFKQLVLLQQGKFVVVSKKSLKDKIKKKYFQKGVSIQVLERIAIYKTL
jgi:16S rRNA C1402 N4-methylase RsmH